MVKAETELTWKDLEIGSIVTEPGNAIKYKTGDWRSQKPVFDLESVSNVAFATFTVPRGASGRMMRENLRLTCTIARGVVSVP